MDPNQLGDLIVQHKWVAVAALVIGLIVRVLKSDTTIPIVVPPLWRSWLALGLGVVSGVLEKVSTGVTWTSAIVDGLVAGVLAIIGHETIIEGLRGGKELPIPGLMTSPEIPPVEHDEPVVVVTPTIPPPPPPKDAA
jgi:hypothetical protein